MIFIWKKMKKGKRKEMKDNDVYLDKEKEGKSKRKMMFIWKKKKKNQEKGKRKIMEEENRMKKINDVYLEEEKSKGWCLFRRRKRQRK